MKDQAPENCRRFSLRCALFLTLMTVLLLPCAAFADGAGKTVRVGWYESTFNTTDLSGRRSGYGYEYQQKVAAYSGWHYEYVSGGWSALLQMLKDGEIDLLSDVSYTQERAENMLFSSLPMGTEEYYVFVRPDNRDVTPDAPSSLNGKRIGVNRDSIQEDFYIEWDNINLQDEVELANSRLTLAKAMEIEKRIGVTN